MNGRTDVTIKVISLEGMTRHMSDIYADECNKSPHEILHTCPITLIQNIHKT